MIQVLKRWNLHKILSETCDSLASIGLKRTLSVIQNRLGDILFDLRYNTETVQIETLESLETVGENAQRGQRYQPTGALAFRKICKEIAIGPDDIFIDYGCGKGRTLLLASLRGFKKVIGIEFSSQLCSSCAENIQHFRNKTGSDAVFEVICNDVINFRLRNDETVFYFFHPFDDAVMKHVLDNIIKSLEDRPRMIHLIYYLPRHYSIFLNYPQFRITKKLISYGYECLIYRYEPS
ncbi:MAG: class I SAM-dependent methyltransferase [Blastochloris sp.]|nr:class I SAM-dependent methyltransferase [Blastochloris sp.]